MKKIFIGIMAVLVCFTLTACNSNNSSNNEKNENKQEESTSNLSNVQSEIEALGVECEKTETAYEMVGAIDGFKLNSDDYTLEIYKFDTSSDAYKTAEENQELVLDGMDYSFDAKVQNGYAYIIDDNFPQHDEVVKILNNLK